MPLSQLPHRLSSVSSKVAVYLMIAVVFEAGPGVAAPENSSVTVTDDKADHSRGLFGPFRIGPVVGVGLPNLLDFGVTSKLTRYFGAGFHVGVIPKFRIGYYGDATLSFVEYDVYGRAYPFGSSIFVGAGVGYATATGTLVSSYDLTAYQAIVPSLPATFLLNSEGSVHTLVLRPEIGLFHTFNSGFSIGFGVGVQVPIAPSEVHINENLPAGLPQSAIDQFVGPNNQKVRNTLHTIGRTPIPTVSVFVGWLF
jgi:hypothetical protein